MNQLTNMRSLDLPLVEEINLTGNQIENLEGLDKMINLKRLIMPKNFLSETDNLLFMKSKSLEYADFSYNRLPMSYLDKLTEIVRFLSNLKDIYLTGNEITINKYYKVKLAQNLKLKLEFVFYSVSFRKTKYFG